jgi:hypothetical protein
MNYIIRIIHDGISYLLIMNYLCYVNLIEIIYFD